MAAVWVSAVAAAAVGMQVKDRPIPILIGTEFADTAKYRYLLYGMLGIVHA
jgi:hypothetical protein